METTFIYSLSCPNTGNVRYIGKSNNPDSRLKLHLAKCKTDSPSLKNSWLQGLKNIGLTPILDIIDEVPLDNWMFWEQHYISLYKSWGFSLLNMTDGGDNPPVSRWNKGKKMSAESKLKMSLAQKGNKNNLGKKGSIEKSKKLSDAHKGNKYSLGRILTDETKAKISHSNKGKQTMLGKKHSDEAKAKMSLIRLGIKLSVETKQKMSTAKTGLVHSEETKQKIRLARLAK